MERLILGHNSGQLITVEQNAQIGRDTGPGRDARTWYTNRSQPSDFADLELVINIAGSPYMSRNHVGIRREGETYTIQDLNSLNGTFRNYVRLTPGIHYPLAVGDHIGLASDQFMVGDTTAVFTDPVTRRLRAGFESALRPSWYLGLAGCARNDPERRVLQASVGRIARELRRRGYENVVLGVDAKGVALSTIIETLRQRAYAAGAGAHTFFQYSGHGTTEGLVINESEILTPRLLFDVIGSIRGKKFLFLDACHAGIFLADKALIPPHTAILAATRTADALAYSEPVGGPDDVANGPMLKLSRRLWELLRSRPGAFNILSERSSLEATLRAEGDGTVYVQQPGMNTVTYTVCVQSVFLTGAWGAVDVEQTAPEHKALLKSA